MSDPMMHHPESAELRTPPHDVVAEQSTLGGMLLSADAIGEVVEITRSADFYRPAHATIFDMIEDLYGRGLPVDPVTISAALTGNGEILRVGGAAYLHTLIASVPTAANAGYYARIVAERAVQRRMIEAGTRIAQFGYAQTGGEDVQSLLALAQGALDEVPDGGTPTGGAVTMREVRAEHLQTLEDLQAGRVPPGLPTGFADLTALLGGWKPGQLIIVAGRPGMGKSTATLDFLRHGALHEEKPSVVFSLEMSKSELWLKMVSAELKIPYDALAKYGGLTDEHWRRIRRALEDDERLASRNLFIDDTANITVSQIRARARQIKARHGLGLVVVDYLQLMTSPKRTESRQQEVSDLSRGLKLLAKELAVPVIAVSQLNRGPEQRTDKRPQLSDLRESGSLEQDADIVILLHRDDYYDKESPRAGEVDFIVAKHRSGRTDTITVASQLNYSRFAEITIGV
jgi:replicative DNA helicase